MKRTMQAATTAGAALAIGLCAAAAPAAATPSTDTLAVIKAKAASATNKRLVALNAAIPTVTNDAHLTDAHRSAILTTLNADVAGMQQQEAKVAADTTVDTARADYDAIFTQYRVFAVALPQAHFAAAADRLTDDAIPRLNDAHTKLSADLASSGKSTPQLQADLADMVAKLAQAQQALIGVADSALAVTPAQYDANHAVLASDRAAVRTALADVRAAEADADAVAAALS